QKVAAIAKRVPIIWSGGTEGLMSPHATIFTREPDRGSPAGSKRLALGTAYTRDLLPEEFGTAVHARVAADGVRAAIKDAGIDATADLHFVQIKTGALTTERVNEARRRGKGVITSDTYKSMAYGRAAGTASRNVGGRGHQLHPPHSRGGERRGRVGHRRHDVLRVGGRRAPGAAQRRCRRGSGAGRRRALSPGISI